MSVYNIFFDKKIKTLKLYSVTNVNFHLLHKFAFRSVKTETSQVVDAEHSSNVAMPTVGAMATETTVIPWTVFNLALRVDVQERTLFVVTSVYIYKYDLLLPR